MAITIPWQPIVINPVVGRGYAHPRKVWMIRIDAAIDDAYSYTSTCIA